MRVSKLIFCFVMLENIFEENRRGLLPTLWLNNL